MSNEILVKLIDDSQHFLELASKANQMSVANMEAFVNFQMNASVSRVKSYMDLTENAIKLNDMTSYRAFLDKYGETIAELRRQFNMDTKTLADMIEQFKSEFDKWVQDGQLPPLERTSLETHSVDPPKPL